MDFMFANLCAVKGKAKFVFVHFLQVAWDGDGNAEVTLPGHYKGALLILLYFLNIITTLTVRHG